MPLESVLGNIVNRTAFLYRIGGQDIGFLQLDATVSETHSRSARITQNEIEDGSNITDNVILDNDRFTIEGLISEAPLPSNDIRDLTLQVQNAGFGALNDVAGVLSGGLLNNAGAITKRISALIQLENFQKNKIPFTVITGLKQYENVLLERISIPVSYKDGNSLRFKAECQVVRIVQSQTVTIPAASVENQSAAAQSSLGKQGTAPATATEAAKGSLAFQLFAG